MITKGNNHLLFWPDWMRMLFLVAITVISITVTVLGLTWLLKLLQLAD